MRNLLIIGAGGCGREVLQWVKDINKMTPLWNIKGFLDDNTTALYGKCCDVGIISKINDYRIQNDDNFVCCIADSKIRKQVIELLEKKGARFISIIHPMTIIADNCEIERAVIIYPYSVISDNVKLGKGCIINTHSSVAHDSQLGDYCTISAHCDITGNCLLGNSVFLGSSSKMIPGTKIGDSAYICAGSMVMTQVKEDGKVIGNPAKSIQI